MDNQVTYETVVELLPAYAISALEHDEMLAVEAYLQRQQTLLSRVAELALATAQLAYAAPAVPLSANVKRNLMAQVRAQADNTQRLPTVARAADSTPAPPINLPSNPLLVQRPPERTPDGRQERALALGRTQQLRTAPRAVQPPLPAPTRPQKFNFGWAAAAAIAVAALFIIWVDMGVQRQVGQLQTQLANRDTTITELSQQLQVKDAEIEQNRLQLAFFAAPTQIVALTGTADAPAGAGGVFYQHNERGLLVVHGLAQLPADQSYQLWLIPPDADPVSAGFLAMQSTDINRQQITLPTDGLTYNAIGISVEPASGSPAPTGKIVILGAKA